MPLYTLGTVLLKPTLLSKAAKNLTFESFSEGFTLSCISWLRLQIFSLKGRLFMWNDAFEMQTCCRIWVEIECYYTHAVEGSITAHPTLPHLRHSSRSEKKEKKQPRRKHRDQQKDIFYSSHVFEQDRPRYKYIDATGRLAEGLRVWRVCECTLFKDDLWRKRRSCMFYMRKRRHLLRTGDSRNSWTGSDGAELSAVPPPQRQWKVGVESHYNRQFKKKKKSSRKETPAGFKVDHDSWCAVKLYIWAALMLKAGVWPSIECCVWFTAAFVHHFFPRGSAQICLALTQYFTVLSQFLGSCVFIWP